VNPVPEKADRAWNSALFESIPLIIKATAAAFTIRKETKITSKVGTRKYKSCI